ncbi:MAG TPA: methionyl-tRNA formyltransferase [Actinomycetota bacterium]
MRGGDEPAGAPVVSGRRPLRVAFLGNDPWSVPPLEALAASVHRPALVVTRVPRPAGRGSRLTPTAVADAARRLGFEPTEVDTVRQGPGFDALASPRPDVLVVVAYGEILPDDVLALPTIAPVNLHFSLLPRLRGASPVQHALLHGLDRTGVTTMVMDAGLDTGPVLLQRTEDVREDDDAGSLGARLARIGGDLLVATLDHLAAGSLEPRPQEGEPSSAPKLRAGDRVLHWSEPADALVRRVRALAPDPAATTEFRGNGLKVFRASALDGPTGTPGTVAAVDRDGVVVAAGSGAVRLEEVAPSGRARMGGGDFARGFHPAPGEPLGGG